MCVLVLSLSHQPSCIFTSGVVFKVEDGCVSKFPPFQPTSQKREPPQETLSCFFAVSSKASFLGRGLDWIIEDPLMIRHESFSRLVVFFVLGAKALAVEVAFIAALALVSRLACSSECKELILLLSSGGRASEVDGAFGDYIFQRLVYLTSLSLLFLLLVDVSAIVSQPKNIVSGFISSRNGV
ncbi:uncharacterized protein LOC111831250 isoform X2 [Capsella rubella]|uniref:uncharacterized protein LOC111831250 isoform X2 n=1 Tax=Capsella rubella TaxID=81985 RepID=UPI000CD55C90|nr:uncharacterized protein LOC111831250 isoform X2 [Capsella rubella]